MVASTPEYHLLGKRVPIDRLRLGSIITSIEKTTRLNTGKEPSIPTDRLDYWHDTDFKISRTDTLNGEVGVNARLAAVERVGIESEINGKHTNVDTYTFGDVHTLEFESGQDDYIEAAKAEGVKTYLKATSCGPVFYVTGIKVGCVPTTNPESGPTFEAQRVKGMGGSLSLGINMPSMASIGPNAVGNKDLTITQQYREHNDRIFAIRVKKLQYKRTGFLGPKEWIARDYDRGAEVAGEEARRKQEEKEPELVSDEVEEVSLNEQELKDYKKIEKTNGQGQRITYIAPRGW